ncbi:hypothetical protein [Burkholderia cepacia]|uniref:hypothetical protein n=1 Tax=Burkholderia cepacia TaxID=292 RepID=UPI00398ED080
MTTQINWSQFCQAVLTGAPASVYGPVPTGSQASISAASAWNPVAASGNAVVDLFVVPSGGSETDATHLDRISVPPGAALPLVNAINQKLTAGMSLYAVGNGATLTISGSVAS